MKPTHKEFTNDEEVITVVNQLKTQNISEDDIYVITHDDDRTNRVADQADANKVSVSETGLGTSIKNVFRKKGDELRAKFEELGYSSVEAEALEERLDQGKIIVIVTNQEQLVRF
ncbi:general stress protein [Alkalihalobacillus pseudalcaliphilus]|uniref:general stress protein n=1 Tax=Alkalihalobacillus pseudalcaliphilus TaxID=79884 RepID=UPI00064E0BE0|nr:general stress protein [Alkalihalobacillus pseudalcaliphilus]KMK76249.1 general stress protein [Alkalihalobacillus pseudalcaliphilus]